MIADHGDLLAHRERDEAEHVALAGLVDDHDVEPGGGDVEALDDARQRHDPHRHGVAAFGEGLARLLLEPADALAGALADLLVQGEPAAQRLLLLERGAAELGVPRERLDVARGGVLQLLADPGQLGEQVLEIDRVQPRERLIEQAIAERVLEAARRLAALVRRLPLAQRGPPRRGRGLEAIEQLAPPRDLAGERLDVAQAGVALDVGVVVAVADRGAQELDDRVRGAPGREPLEAVDPALAELRELARPDVGLALGEDRPELVERRADPGRRGRRAGRELVDDAVPDQAGAGERGEARTPDLVVPGQRLGDVHGELGGLLLGPLAQRRRGGRAEPVHLVVPAARQAVAQRLDLERGDQGAEVLDGPRLVALDLARLLDLAPARVEQARGAAELLARLEVADDLAARIEQLLARPLGLDHRGVRQDQLVAQRDLVRGAARLVAQRQPRRLLGGAAAPGLETLPDPRGVVGQPRRGAARDVLELGERLGGLPVVRPQLAGRGRPDLLDPPELVEQRGELERRRQVADPGALGVEQLLVAGGDPRVELVQLGDLGDGERQIGADRAGDPVVDACGVADAPGGIGGRDRLAEHGQLGVLVVDRLEQPRAHRFLLVAQAVARAGQALDVLLELAARGRREVVEDAGDRLLELHRALLVGVEQADAQRLQRLGDLVAHDAQRLGRVAGDEDRLALGEEVADQVGDRVALAGAGRALHEDRAGLVEAVDHALLLAVGVAGQEEVVAAGLGGAPAAAAGLDPDDAQQRLGQLVAAGQDVDVAPDGVGEALVAVAEVERGLPVDVRTGRLADVAQRVEVHAVRPQGLDQALEELAGGLAAERVELLGGDAILEREQPLGIDVEVAQQRRVEIGRIAGLAQREPRLVGVELELDPLQQQGMAHDLAGVRRDQDAVADEQLELLGLALELAPQREQLREQARRGDHLALAGLPPPPLLEPVLERQDALLLVLEALLAAGRAQRPGRHHGRGDAGLFPAGLEPVLEQHRRCGTLGLGRAIDADEKAAA